MIATHDRVDKYPDLTGNYEVIQLRINQKLLHSNTYADSMLTVVYFDIKNGCVFQFNTLAKRWNGTFTKDRNHLKIKWFSPPGKPVFDGTMDKINDSGKLMLIGLFGKDLITVILQKVNN